MKLTKRRWGVVIAIAIALGVSAYALVPKAIQVDAVKAVRGPLATTIDEDGQTRVRERFVVAAPVAGRLRRVSIHPGDSVTEASLLLRLDAAPLDARQKLELEARVESAERSRSEAEARMRQAGAAWEQAKRETVRIRRLAGESIASKEALEQAATAESMRAKELEASRFAAESAKFNVEIARAGLVALEGTGHEVAIHSPVRGSVLRVLHESEAVVQAGAPLIEIGDPSTLEIVLDILTADAVKICPGDEVVIEEWGGEKPLQARVRLVEPSAFTKVSALGVEEQRVNVIADLIDAPPRVGDGFRVEGRVVIWKGDALRVPSTALFREQDGWALFAVEGGRARLLRVVPGHRSATDTEIASGIVPGSIVVSHPSDQVRDGVRVRPRLQ